jgi:hypothetical protein
VAWKTDAAGNQQNDDLFTFGCNFGVHKKKERNKNKNKLPPILHDFTEKEKSN